MGWIQRWGWGDPKDGVGVTLRMGRHQGWGGGDPKNRDEVTPEMGMGLG